jgi:hypothetical protein
MDLDELKSLWQQTERRLEAMEPALRLQQRLARAGALDRVRSKIRFAHLVLWYEVACGGVAALFTGSYLADHLGEIRFAAPAALLHLGAILIIGFAAWQLAALGKIDYGGPVLDIQRKLAELRVVRARGNRWLLLSAPLLWALLIVVVPHGLIGLDVYRAFGIAWVGGNLIFGLAVLAAAAWASRRFATWFGSSRLLRGLGDDLTGRRLAAVSGFLTDIAAFEMEG